MESAPGVWHAAFPNYDSSAFVSLCFVSVSRPCASPLPCTGRRRTPGPAASSQSAGGQTLRQRRAIPHDAPRMSKQTRYEIIRDFETQLVYARTAFPMGTKGLQLKDGVITPNGEELQQALSLWGPAIKPGDPAHISIRSDQRTTTFISRSMAARCITRSGTRRLRSGAGGELCLRQAGERPRS